MERDHSNVHTESQSERMRREATISDNSSLVSDSDKEKEDGAMILMMLSRDFDFFDKKSHDDEDLEDPDEDFRKNNVNYVNNFDSGRGGYKCKTCNKVFHSYQALGGHRASHNVGRAVSNKTVKRSKRRVNDYECPVCGKVFASGQALGGHKRSHWASNSETSSFDISFRVSNDQNFWM